MTTPWDKGGTNLVLNYAVTLCIFLYLYLVSELNTALLPVQFITLSISAEHHNCPLTLESQSYDFSILVHEYVHTWSQDCGNT